MELDHPKVRDGGTPLRQCSGQALPAPEAGALPGRGLRDTLHVCQVIASINRDTGGPAVTVTKLASALVETGQVDCKLITLDYAALGPQVIPGNAEVVSLPAGFFARRFRGWSRKLRSCLQQQAAGSDLIHDHGLWMYPNLYARQAAVSADIPLVISPRGMLQQWALGRSRARKFIAWRMFEKQNLESARLFHATSEAEAADLRRLSFPQPIAIIPNGIDVPTASGERKTLEAKFPELKGRRWVLFLSRLHPKKGVAELLSAWHAVENRNSDWHLIIAGPDLDGYGKHCQALAAANGLGAGVTFTGMLSGGEKSAALSNAELFVLPTHSENFGVAVAEALAHGVPVITTKGAPWPELEARGCGWWIDLNEDNLRSTIHTALALSAEERRAKGERGRTWMSEEFSWKTVADRMRQTYYWIAGRADRPEWVLE